MNKDNTNNKKVNDRWQQKDSVKKGNIGEYIVNEYLELKGYIIYKPSTMGPHSFDLMAMSGKTNIMLADIKTKPSRIKYPDTGFNYKHYKEYMEVKNRYDIPMFIFFVDEQKGMVYGNWLSELIKPKFVSNNQYPLYQKPIIYFPLINMKFIKKLTIEEIEEIKKHSNISEKYKK